MKWLFELLLAPLYWLWRWHERETLPEVVLCDCGEIRPDQPADDGEIRP